MLEHALEIYWSKKRAPYTLRYAAARYGSFDFLMQLGLLFGQRREYHKYTLNDVDEILYDFVTTHYPDDTVLHQLATVDYYLQHKIRPKTQFWPELPPADKNRLLADRRLNPQQFRYVVLPLAFDFHVFKTAGEITDTPQLLVVQYTGVRAPEIVHADRVFSAAT